MRRRFQAVLVGLAVFAAVLALSPVGNAEAQPGGASQVFINEIHYDNAGSDTGEFVEIAGPAGSDLSGWQVVFYNGSNGTSYNSASGAVLADAGSGVGFLELQLAGIQNGSPDGIALIDAGGNVVQFLSYEGAFTATDGPAAGVTSTDIGVAEAGNTAVGDSLQLTGSGNTASDFTWNAPAPSTPGAANTGQTFTTGPSGPSDPALNEFSISTTGTDVEYLEIAGDTVTDYSSYTIVEINGNDAPGTISNFFPVGSTGTNGLFNIDLAANTLTNNPVTLALVKDFTGATNDDLDSDDDGTFDTTPWSQIADSVSIDTGVAYSSTVLDAAFDDAVIDNDFPPGGASRIPDRTGAWVRNDFDLNPIQAGTPDAGEAENTPGEPNAEVTVVVNPTSVFIHEIQGSGASSPLDGQLVSTTAIVTSLLTDNDVLDGFFIQHIDIQHDADPATSEGVFVFCRGNCPAGLAVGDDVTVQGTAVDFNGSTQINVQSGSVAVLSSGNTLPTATPIALGGGSTTDEANFEATEAMIVSFTETLAVSEYFELARFGNVVLTASERSSQFTDTNTPSVAGYAAYLADLATRRIILDDDNNDQNDRTTAPEENEPYAWPDGGLSTTNFFRGGDTIAGLTGVIDWSFGAWRIRPIDGVANTFAPANPRPTSVPAVGGTLTVASFNVLNYFTTLDNPGNTCGPAPEDCRGANSIQELERQRTKIVAAMVELDADVLGLIEIENDAGAAVTDLVTALNAATALGTYDYIDTGVIGPDVIKQAFIYQPATVTPVGDFVILDSSVDANFNDDKNRPALIQTFEEVANGERVTIAVNHLKSKGSDCNDLGDPDLNDGAANCNLTRTAAATALAAYLATDPTASGDTDVLIIGDLNAYAMETPITALEAAGYSDLVSDFGGDAAYTYLFDGQIGSLDYAMANGSLVSQITGTDVWHINADEVPLLDYNDDIQDPNEESFRRESSALPLYSPDAFRSSDHDPVVVGLALEAASGSNVTISILHNNDGESKLLPDGDFPGIARFVTTLKNLQDNAGTDGVITLTSGDNFLASKEFNASLENGVPFYDSIALSGLYDAMALGNHDFDFGPDVTADFINGFDPAIPFLSANADFSGEPALAALVASGQIAASAVIDVAGTQVGVIGAVTPLLPNISSPRNVVISADVAAAVNAEVATLEAAGVNKIVLISHLQGVDEDRALIPLLSGVDVAIAGGGDELFANAGDTCTIGTVADTYPGAVTDADGKTVPLVTGPGGYRCIGQLDVTFTPDGELVSASGAANLVPLDATPDPTVLTTVEEPVTAAVASLEANVIATSEVDLDGVRTSVRTGSSNEGSLLADALLDTGIALAGDFGAPSPVIGIQNGGGIRNDAVIPAGDITEGDTFDIAPFSNFVVVTEVPRDTLKVLLEVAYGGLPAASGRFAQPAGFEVRVDTSAPAREIDSSCVVIGSSGERVLDVTLNDGTVIIENGVVVPGPDVALATIDFLARGGDCYPLGELPFTVLGVSYQQALADYITGTLGALITAADYPAAGTERVIIVDDSVPPVLTLPDDLMADATSAAGAQVVYTATATDAIDGDVAVTCSPESGATFPVGITTVDCSATDSDFNTAAGSFTVTITELDQVLCHGKVVTINMQLGASGVGTSGADVILGTSGADVIVARGGDDTVCGLGGDDTIFGGSGNDVLLGNRGNDILRGSYGDDVLRGGQDHDWLFGGSGHDTLAGSNGNDIVFGSSGNDAIAGGAGYDVIFGNRGNDVISGGAGGDFVLAGGGRDVVTGNSGPDQLYGGSGADIITGNSGDDVIFAGGGDDSVSGGQGNDFCSGGGQVTADITDGTCETSNGFP